MKKIVFTNENIDNQIVKEVMQFASLGYDMASILVSRGITTKEEVKRFLNPSVKNLSDPFLLSGMTNAVQRISMAKASGENVLIFGDYDADGVSATSTLYHALKEYGIENVYAVIPERESGYGLNEDIISTLAEEYFIDLIITVDCGISDKDAIKFINDELGIDVIVTDHHELPENLPETILINPKLDEGKVFDGLCGAGVAYKLAKALIGNSADKYLDIVALATVADSMNLINENRDIVFEGLKLFKKGKIRKAFELLLNDNVSEVTAQTLAYQIAPKINAAGRMGDANSALQLFLTDSEEEIFELAVKLTKYNQERQAECDKLYKSAKSQIESQGVLDKVIMLYDESWSTGFVGIVAARIAGEYNRPVILFAGHNGELKGSARSIDNINIFDAISANSEFLIEYGGHSQAAGVAVKKDNFELFKNGVNEYLKENYDINAFVPTICVEKQITEKIDLDFVEQLELLEPTGVGNRRPLFLINVNQVDANLLKTCSPHLLIKTEYIDLLWFSACNEKERLNLQLNKDIVFETNLSIYNGKKYIKGYVKDVVYYNDDVKVIENYAFDRAINSLKYKIFKQDEEYLTLEETKALINKCVLDVYGTCFLISDYKNLEIYPELSKVEKALFNVCGYNLRNVVLISPDIDVDLDGYKNVIFLDNPINKVNVSKGQKLFINKDINGKREIESLSTDREVFMEYYSVIRRLSGKTFTNGVSFYNRYASDKDVKQFLFCLAVFLELNFFSVDNDVLKENLAKKSDLNLSTIYTSIKEMNL